MHDMWKKWKMAAR